MLAILTLFRQLLLGTILFTPMERFWPARPAQPLLRSGLALDLGYAALVAIIVGPVVAFALGIFSTRFHIWMPPDLAASIAGQPWGLRLTAALILAELIGYGVHRALHAFPSLWKMHRVHHSSVEMDWVSGHRQHPVEAALLLMAAGIAPILFFLPLRGLLAVILIQRLHTLFVHANVALPVGRWEWVIGGPRFHGWHHAAQRDAGNYASVLPVVDWIFGTAHLPAGQPPALGLAPEDALVQAPSDDVD